MNMSVLDTPFFGLILTILAFHVGLYIFKKTKLPICNPLLIGIIITMSIISYYNIPLDYFRKGGEYITFLLGPATVSLAIPLYKQFDKLKENFIPIILGALVGATTAILSTIYLGKLLGIDKKLLISFMPKSITTPIGIELSKHLGGIPAITIFAIIVTGIIGNVLAPMVCKKFRISHPVAKGLGIGISSHAVGTSKAIEMGEIEGAMSALSIVVSGIITFGIAPLLLFLV